MKRTILPVAVALVAAACGAGTGGNAPEAVALFYRYADVETVEYAITVDQTAEIHVDGDVPADEAQDLPLDMEMEGTIAGTIRYETRPGPEPDTTELRIVTDFADADLEIVANGESIPTAGVRPEEAIPPVDLTVVVDERGTVLSVTSEQLGDISELVGDVSGLQNLAHNPLGTPVGPAFPDRPITVGDEWTETISRPGPNDTTIVTKATHRLVEIETVGGRELYVVESRAETEAFELDLGEPLRELFAGLAEAGGEEMARLADELVLVVRSEPAVAETTSRFDPETGLVVAAQVAARTSLSVDMKIPDEATGELASLQVDMDLDQRVTYDLVAP